MTVELLRAVGATIVSLAAVTASLALLGRTRPARWVWRRLVSDPLRSAFRTEVVEVTTGPLDDLRQRIDATHTRVDETMERLDTHMLEEANAARVVEARLGRMEHTVDRIAATVTPNP